MGSMQRNQLHKQPLYQQVHDLLAKRIADGEFPDGTYLPNEYDLSMVLGVSIGTIRKAVDLLVQSNVVQRLQGKGTRVQDQRWVRMHDKLNRIRFGSDASIGFWQYTRISQEIRFVGEDIGKILQIEPQDKAHFLQDLRTQPPDSKIFDTIYIPVDSIPDIDLPGGDFPSLIRLAQQNRIVIGPVEERVSAVLATDDIAEVLDVEAGVPLLKIVRRCFSEVGVAVEYRVSYVATDTGSYWCSES